MMYGFHSGTVGSCERVYWSIGWNTSAESASSKFVPRPGTSAGLDACHGTELSSVSEPDSVRPGSTPWPTISTASTA